MNSSSFGYFENPSSELQKILDQYATISFNVTIQVSKVKYVYNKTDSTYNKIVANFDKLTS